MKAIIFYNEGAKILRLKSLKKGTEAYLIGLCPFRSVRGTKIPGVTIGGKFTSFPFHNIRMV